jgi:hypothetical protein
MTKRIPLMLAALIVASAAMPVTAHADPDTCRAAGGQWWSTTGQRCRGDDLNQWRIGNSTQLYCWYYICGPNGEPR